MKWIAGSMMLMAAFYLLFLLVYASHKMLQSW